MNVLGVIHARMQMGAHVNNGKSAVPSGSDDVRNRNRRRILAAVRRSGEASRTEISQQTGLSPATVSAITSDFIDEGVLLSPTQAISVTGRGRPQVALSANPAAALVCSVYFQLNYVSAAIVDYSGKSISEHTDKISTVNISAPEIKAAIIFLH